MPRAVLEPINRSGVRAAQLAEAYTGRLHSLASVELCGPFELNGIDAALKELNLRNLFHTLHVDLNINDLRGVLRIFYRSAVGTIGFRIKAWQGNLPVRPLNKGDPALLRAQQCLRVFGKEIDRGFDHHPFVRTETPGSFPERDVEQVPREVRQGFNDAHCRLLPQPDSFRLLARPRGEQRILAEREIRRERDNPSRFIHAVGTVPPSITYSVPVMLAA